MIPSSRDEGTSRAAYIIQFQFTATVSTYTYNFPNRHDAVVDSLSRGLCIKLPAREPPPVKSHIRVRHSVFHTERAEARGGFPSMSSGICILSCLFQRKTASLEFGARARLLRVHASPLLRSRGAAAMHPVEVAEREGFFPIGTGPDAKMQQAHCTRWTRSLSELSFLPAARRLQRGSLPSYPTPERALAIP